MMERPILHFPMVRIHHIAVEEAREAAKTVSTQTLETDPSSPNYYSKKSQQTWPSLRMTSLKPATHQQPRRRISMVSGSIRIPPEDNYSYGSTTYIYSSIHVFSQREEVKRGQHRFCGRQMKGIFLWWTTTPMSRGANAVFIVTFRHNSYIVLLSSVGGENSYFLPLKS